MWIALYSNNTPDIKAIHEERNYFLQRRKQPDGLKQIRTSQSWVGETATRQHVLSHPKEDYNSVETSNPKSNFKNQVQENVFPNDPKKADLDELGRGKDEEQAIISHLADGTEPEIHRGHNYDFESKEGLLEAEFKMASRARRMAREVGSSHSSDGPCVDMTFGFYPDYTKSCKVFYLCLRARQRTFLCPNGRVFDRRNLDCVEDTIENQVCKPQQMTCTEKTIHFYPDYRTNCKRFFMCLNGVTHYYGCPGSMVFSPNLLACVPKTVYDCIDPYLAIEIGVIRIEPVTEEQPSTTTTKKPIQRITSAHEVITSVHISNSGVVRASASGSSLDKLLGGIVVGSHTQTNKPNVIPARGAQSPSNPTDGPGLGSRTQTPAEPSGSSSSSPEVIRGKRIMLY